MPYSISYEKKLLTATAHYILFHFLPNSKNKFVTIVFDDLADTLYIKHTFLEWLRILYNIFNLHTVKINIFSLFSDQLHKKIDIDSIIELYQLLDKTKSVISEEKICLLTQQTFLQQNIPTKFDIQTIVCNTSLNFDNFISMMVKLGYTRKEYVESIGEFAVRGSIIDIWPNGFLYYDNQNRKLRYPVRVILEDNIVTQIKQFDITTQRSLPYEKVEKVEVYPVNFDFLVERQNVHDENIVVKLEQFLSKNDSEIIFCSEQLLSTIEIPYFASVRYFGNVELFNKDLSKFVSEGYNVIVGYNYDSELDRLKSLIQDVLIEKIIFVKTSLTTGFYSEKEKLAFVTFHDIYSKYELYSYPKQKVYHGVKLDNVWEIQPGDYVVHNDYGIAKFVGIRKINIHGVDKEFLTLLFRDNALLYVPLTEIDTVEKYVSFTDKPPSLSPLSKEVWTKTTTRIKDKLKEFALQLYTIYTKRKQLKGIKFEIDTHLDKLFAETFEYEETEDQKKAISDVLKDMNNDYPMDRIIVGDVGFGKTEVALRATFTAVYNGKQVAVLCPTTVLAEQHYRIFVSRLDRFGVNVAILTRLQSKKYIEETIKKISNGEIDVVIGTHLLLSDKIKFYNLGLVIIDEEHKFGVRQKEKIRLKFKPLDITGNNQPIPDVLSLTATPIPRTLAFGLEGIKDISVIETPPEGRLPVETFVLPYDEHIIIDAINKELHRNGQVYYVFNDISLIEHKTNKIRSYFPTAVVEFIHSKLPSKKIEEIMTKFVKEEIQILVSTTIIESGLDIPNVNTIIVEKVENFGLAQLYQLRGRVGRREKKAYCYLFYSPENLTGNVKKRISALLEFTQSLGSGYKLALRDLEIRGAGEILGTKQHGFVNEVGLSMYSKIMQQLVKEISGVKYEEVEPKIKVDIEAYLPEEYIPDCETRILFYRKLLQAKNVKEIDEIKEEIYDRFGKPTQLHAVENLFLLAVFRVMLKKYKISQFCIEDAQETNGLKISFVGRDEKLNSLLRKKIQSCKELTVEKDYGENVFVISRKYKDKTEILEMILKSIVQNVK